MSELPKHRYYLRRDSFNDVTCITEVLGIEDRSGFIEVRNYDEYGDGEASYPAHWFDKTNDPLSLSDSIVESVESLEHGLSLLIPTSYWVGSEIPNWHILIVSMLDAGVTRFRTNKQEVANLINSAGQLKQMEIDVILCDWPQSPWEKTDDIPEIAERNCRRGIRKRLSAPGTPCPL
jgi:hypothetical protein